MKIGKKGELCAKMFLMKHGYVILALNLSVYLGKQVGEIDILALKNQCLYIVEVKSTVRSNSVGWITSDILTHKKYSRLKQIRIIILAMKSYSLNEERGLVRPVAKRVSTRACARHTGQDRLHDVLSAGVLGQVRWVKIVLAEVVFLSDTVYDIQFTHINSGYY